MLIYTDIITGDELCSDAYPMVEVLDVFYEVDCSMVTIKEGDVDIGANASAEEQTESLEDGAMTVNNLVHSFRLQQTSFDKKSYLTYLKGYMKAIKTHLQTTNPDRVAVFEKAAADGAKKIVGNFKDFEFYIGEGMNPDGWKDGLKEVKV